MPFNYAFTRSETKPAQASSALWFTLGADRGLQYGYDDVIDPAAVLLYGKTEEEVQSLAGSGFGARCVPLGICLASSIRACIHNRLSKVRKWEILTIVSAEDMEIS